MVYFQSTFPKISFTHYDKTSPYFSFDANGTDISSQNIQSYSFQRSVNSFSGSFSITFKEEITKSDSFLDKVENFDIVRIYETGDEKELSFIGVVCDINYTSSVQGFQKIITITGKSVEYLFEILNISLEVTAMVITNKAVVSAIENINSTLSANNGKTVSIKSALNSLYDSFKKVANNNEALSNVGIIKIIEQLYGNDKFIVPDDINFKLPIVSNLFSGDVANYISYIQNFLPQNVYEMFGVIESGSPKIMVREKPYSKTAWIKLESTTIPSSLLTNYTITKSIDEVYTYFYSYVEGSALSSEFYQRAGAGSDIVACDEEKRKLYGYRPLRCNFVGYNTVNAQTESNIKNMKETFSALSQQMKEWYSKLDEMWNGTFTCVIAKNEPVAKIGEVINVLSGQFYVTGEDHQWRYGSSPKVTYHCERGGNYGIDGTFSKLSGISHTLSDFEAIGNSNYFKGVITKK